MRPEPLTNKAPVICVEGPADALIMVSRSTPPTSIFRVSSAEALIEVSSSASKSIRPVPPMLIEPWPFKSMSSTYKADHATPGRPRESAESEPGDK